MAREISTNYRDLLGTTIRVGDSIKNIRDGFVYEVTSQDCAVNRNGVHIFLSRAHTSRDFEVVEDAAEKKSNPEQPETAPDEAAPLPVATFTPSDQPTKRCTKCGRVLTLDSFYKNRARPDGLSDRCQDCIKEDRRELFKRRKAEADQHSGASEKKTPAPSPRDFSGRVNDRMSESELRAQISLQEELIKQLELDIAGLKKQNDALAHQNNELANTLTGFNEAASPLVKQLQERDNTIDDLREQLLQTSLREEALKIELNEIHSTTGTSHLTDDDLIKELTHRGWEGDIIKELKAHLCQER